MSIDTALPKIVVVLGQTSSGKSNLTVRIARKIGGEVISADSRQIYEGLDLASGKVTKKEMRGVPHHFLSKVSLQRTYTVARYQRDARRVVERILERGKVPIVCGGTSFYIEALIHNYDLPNVPPQAGLRRKLRKKSNEWLFQKLISLDPERALMIDPQNPRRLIRALEVAITTGKKVSPLKKCLAYDALKIGISVPFPILKKRIEKRLNDRLKKGLVKEIQHLHDSGTNWKRLEDLGLEARYVSRFLRGIISYETMRKELLKATVRYAKRQMTWFKKDKNIHWVQSAKEAELLIQSFLLQ